MSGRLQSLRTAWLLATAAICPLAPSALTSAGAAADPPPPPPAPASQIFDDARIFDDEEHAAFSGFLKRYQSETGISIFVAAKSYLIDESIDAHAARLKNAWVGSPRGIIILYVRSTEQMTFAATDDADAFLPRTDLMDAFSAAASRARSLQTEEQSHADRIQVACAELAEALKTRLAERAAGASRFRTRLIQFAFGFSALFALLAAASYALYRLHRQAETKHAQFYYFPPVEVGARYGAQFGGGAIGEIEFARPKAAAPKPARDDAR